MKTLQVLFLPLLLLSLAPAAWAQNLFSEGNALSNRTFNTDTGPTNSQLTLDFTNAQPGILQNILTWGENSGGGGLNGTGQSFEAFVLRPLNSTNYQVVFATGYVTATNVGTNTFAVSGEPFGLQVGDVIAHYGRGIPFNNGTGGPSSVYIAANLPPPVLNTTITVPSATYPLYNDGGRNYAIQVQALGQPFLVTTNNDNGPGSLRQAALNANAFASASTITFTNTLSGQTILLTGGQIELSNNVTIDASALAKGIVLNGNASSRVFYVNGAVVLNSLTITNASSTFGGGMINFGTLIVKNCTFANNDASDFSDGGGAIENWSGATLAVINSTFTGNQAEGGNSDGGGAIIDEGGTLTVINSTFIGNQAGTYGGGIHCFGTLNLTNTIACSNTPDNIIASYASANNLVDTDPQLAPLGNYGGPTPTMPPLPGSPAIDAGVVIPGLATDQRGLPRVVGPAPDIGAVESGDAIPGFIPVVTTNSDAFYSIGAGAVSLREAVAFVPSNSFVTFAPALSGQTIVLTNGQLTLPQGIWIDGSALANGIQISGNHDSLIFNINSNNTATLTSLTMINANGGGADGGALYNAGNTVLNYCTFTGNSTGSGGAIKNAGGSLILNECTLYGNSTTGGGGGGIVNYASLFLNGCTLTGNSAGAYGGAIYSETGAYVTLDDTIAGGNTANDIYNNGTLILSGSNLVQSISGSSSGTPPINASPQLAALRNYGGSTPTMPPLPSSPAIDAGDDSETNFFTTDQRGYPRLVGAHVDIGAVEGVYNAAGPGKIKTIAHLGNGSVQLSFTNVTDAVFPVLASTNLSLSLSNWTQIGFVTESPVGSGKFPFTDTQATNYPQRFYRIGSP